jgi:hypothetical protein
MAAFDQFDYDQQPIENMHQQLGQIKNVRPHGNIPIIHSNCDGSFLIVDWIMLNIWIIIRFDQNDFKIIQTFDLDDISIGIPILAENKDNNVQDLVDVPIIFIIKNRGFRFVAKNIEPVQFMPFAYINEVSHKVVIRRGGYVQKSNYFDATLYNIGQDGSESELDVMLRFYLFEYGSEKNRFILESMFDGQLKLFKIDQTHFLTTENLEFLIVGHKNIEERSYIMEFEIFARDYSLGKALKKAADHHDSDSDD